MEDYNKLEDINSFNKFYSEVIKVYINKFGFILSYVIGLFLCLILLIINKNSSFVDTMISAITFTSAVFALSECIFTKLEIEKKERELLFSLYYLNSYLKKIYTNEIIEKYNNEAREIISLLRNYFEDEELDNFLYGHFSANEKENFLNRVKLISNDEITYFVEDYLKLNDGGTIEESINNEEYISKILNEAKKVEKNHYQIASIIPVIGLTSLFIIVAIRLEIPDNINNILTVASLLLLMLGLLIKEYFESNSLKKLNEEKKEMLKEIIEYIKCKI